MSNHRLEMHPKWMSITGDSLDLGFDKPFHGTPNEIHERSDSDLSLGECLSINAFEKLNQLGEGSERAFIMSIHNISNKVQLTG